MDEAEWLICTEPLRMLAYQSESNVLTRALFPALESLASERKMRLFCAACCRAIWDAIADERSRKIVEVAEAYADRAVSGKELGDAYIAARSFVAEMQEDHADFPAASAVLVAVFARNRYEVVNRSQAKYHARAVVERVVDACRTVEDRERVQRQHCAHLRDIFGNPFHPATLDRTCLTHTVIALARTAYEERILSSGHLDPERLGVLADACEEAGIGGEVLVHLRGEGPHVRGCFAVDLLLDKS